MLEKKIISVCRVGTLHASSLRQHGYTSHLVLASPWEWKWKPLAELWQYKWIPGKVFCQDLAGASSCFTAAVKHISALSPYSSPGTD